MPPWPWAGGLQIQGDPETPANGVAGPCLGHWDQRGYRPGLDRTEAEEKASVHHSGPDALLLLRAGLDRGP